MAAEGQRWVLLNPGPVGLSAGVREAMTRPDLCHREPELAALQAHVRARLLGVYGLAPERWAAILLAGSGTAAVEAMLASLIPAAGKVLIVENGVYGERMRRMAETHGVAHTRLSYRWDAALEPAHIDAALAADPAIDHVALVHHETTTGRLNALGAVAAVCRARGVELLVDTVSSFGAEALELEEGPLGACAATANKCLHGAPGVSFVVVRRELLERRPAPPRTVYLDLHTYARAQDDASTPFTPPVHLLYALAQALDELADAGGWRARRQHYRALAGQVRRGLSALGVEPLLSEAESSVVLSAYQIPKGIGYAQLHDALKAKGYVIYAGQGWLEHEVFRISTMGAVDRADIDGLLTACASILGPPGGPGPAACGYGPRQP